MFAVIFIPEFLLQAVLRHEPELHSRPAALTDPELPKAGVIRLNSRARAAGVGEGISASQALARCPDLLIKSRCLAQEKAATDVLIQTAYAFSPFIEATGPGICAMDLRGLRIVSDETAMAAWAEEIRGALAQFHLDGCIGFAPTPDLARLVASKAMPILAIHNPAEFIADLPIQMLGLSTETLETLNRWGIHTAGALVKLGKDPLAERLGPEVIDVFERLAPDCIRPLKIAALPEIFSEQMEFKTEVETLEPLLFVLRRFTEQLARRIQMLVVAELHLKLGLSSGATHESIFKIPCPTGNAEILFRMLHTHLENVRTDASISSLSLTAKPTWADTHQFGLFETTLRNPNQFAETLARLEALCGPNRVGTPVLESTLRPDAFKLKAADFHETGSTKTSCLPPPSSHLKLGLPLRRFRPPLSAQVEMRECTPALIRSAVCNGRIVDRRGPFFISGNWWDEGHWSREEWDVQMANGTIYRIFRTPSNTASSPQPRASGPKLENLRGEMHPSRDCGSRADALPLHAENDCFVEGVYD